ncbi:MAG: bifunctional 5,10-methylenetetrahydrofolate dehydrogenase/5,10-methenyltetrahydrofolate cyclohydrolase [Alphaproteobacteria bacterium]|nr:bifunctional 5,10-methylenetetrahydrofolate dehydrogenase/5,10-methenyltetrahydrofolate cyclohydrolase [Alphaproteobacteria bacterium]
MTSLKIIDGRALASEILTSVKLQIDPNNPPCFAVIQVGGNPVSNVYIRHKFKKAIALGIEPKHLHFAEDVSEERIEKEIRRLNKDKTIHGVMIQMPLPENLNARKLMDLIASDKDIDGLHSRNLGRLMVGEKGLYSCTPQGIMYAIHSMKKDLTSLHAVVVGRSNLVGKPVAQMLLNANCTVSIVHSKTRDIKSITQKADILVVAVGHANLVKADWVKDGAIVIDVGINRLGDGMLVGDVDFENVKEKAFAITPVPKGIGPLTIAFLMKNIMDAWEIQNDK